MSLTACLLLAAAYASITIATAQKPTTSVSPSIWFDSPKLQNDTITVNLGDNVTIACNFTDKKWVVSIVRWHPDKNSTDSKTNMRRQIKVNTENDFDPDFQAIIDQYPEFSRRLSKSFDDVSGTVQLTITNFQYEDAGDFGCFAARTSNISQYVNVTINVQDTIVYADIQGNQQLQLDNLTADAQLVTFNCSLYHVYGYQDAVQTAWFDTCSLFDNAGNKLAQPKCDGLNLAGTFVDLRNFTDPYRYGEFWPRTFERTKITAQLPLSKAFYNRSVGCFARKNSGANVSDYQTIVQAGVDLHLDPANFRCSAHHVQAKYDSYVDFWCVVQRPIYRQFRIFWEVITSKSVQECETDTSCRNLNGVFVKNVQEAEDNNLYIKEVKAMVQIRANSNTGSYKYRLVAQYLNTKRFVSDNFTITVTGSPDTGAVQNRPSAASRDYASCGLFLALAFVLALRM